MRRQHAGLSDGGRGALRRHERMAWLLSVGAIELYVVVELILEASRPAEAAALVRGREAARLDGALLAGRTLEHPLGNQLALTVGYVELLARHPQLDAELRPLAEEALRGAVQAAETVQRMQQIARLE